MSIKTHLYLDIDGEKLSGPHNCTNHPVIKDTIALPYGKHLKTKLEEDA